MPVVLHSIAILVVAGAAAGSDWSGHWCGEGVNTADRVPLELEISNGGADAAAWLTLPKHGWYRGPALKIEEDGDALVLTFNPRQEQHVLRMERRGEALAGTWTWNDYRADVDLDPCVPELPYTTEEASFSRDGVSFGGTLFLPASPGPHPAIVCYHGSGDNERWWLFDDADHFARLGFACYVWDKRGCGNSGGHWEEADFDILAEDGIAAVEMLKGREDIDPARIGVYGISQACWIMPLAASKCPDIRFILAISGAVTTVEDEGYYDYWYRMDQAGYSEADWQEALALLKEDNAFTRTGEGWEAL
ncbi:MAG: alpha/beta hydrolase, partial [Candidatus Hydrogenedentes bacterium]|nr:alpha/beta hydrolase [Candidatus Hydrogenedentota bacterium]